MKWEEWHAACCRGDAVTTIMDDMSEEMIEAAARSPLVGMCGRPPSELGAAIMEAFGVDGIKAPVPLLASNQHNIVPSPK